MAAQRKQGFKERFSKLGDSWSKQLLSLKKHWVILLVLACFAFASGAQATSWPINELQKAYRDKVSWKAEEERLLNSISPNMQVNYVKQMLGEPIFHNGGELYKEYIFKRKAGWIQIVADKHERIQLYSILVCDPNFKPTVSLPQNRKVTLMRNTLAEKGQDDTYYFLSGATANSYLMEGGYSGNPSNYQSTYLGASDGCGYLNADKGFADSYDLLLETCQKETSLFAGLETVCRHDTKHPKIAEMRKHVTINTVVVTAPLIELHELGPHPQFGPDRIMLRVLPNYYEEPWIRQSQKEQIR